VKFWLISKEAFLNFKEIAKFVEKNKFREINIKINCLVIEIQNEDNSLQYHVPIDYRSQNTRFELEHLYDENDKIISEKNINGRISFINASDENKEKIKKREVIKARYKVFSG
jgi:hypothetical protein